MTSKSPTRLNYCQDLPVSQLKHTIADYTDHTRNDPASFEIAKDSWTHPTYLPLESADIQEGRGAWLRYKKQ
ncbi:hypothetical protein QN379_16270 [Glaciimonas sp. Gout2]|uniref:hypothetical protein n=1 Tax=unclassified Glaciimonas TaxID=2644401 RepID=UPI002B23B06B|nr:MULTISPECIES: hypothetical protein [unclassified Glaciimonas]MEB0010487.1 hypothetical protein [Glaciimonas sp. Cout2]MEB0083563.1 hypothetical protein [Glaciimonas sp. Gout2]